MIIPASTRHKVLDILHAIHPGIVRMKALARGIVWWPNIDRDIEYFVKSCDPCQKVNSQSSNHLEPWPKTNYPFERIHLDFFYSQQKCFLIIFDSYSKWIDIKIMTKTDAMSVIFILQDVFSMCGLPQEIVTDNGPPFRSHLFKKFCLVNGISLPEPPSLHPQSNGAAERSVRTAKEAFNKILLDNRNGKLSISSLVFKFLFDYRNIPSTATGRSPNELLFAFKPKTFLDMIKPREVKFHVNSMKGHFEEGEKVWVRVYNSKIQKWTKGVVKNRLSEVMYHVRVNDQIKKAHRDQLKARVERLPVIVCTKHCEDVSTNHGESVRDVESMANTNKAIPQSENIPEPQTSGDSLNLRKRKLSPEVQPTRILRPRSQLKQPAKFCDVDFSK